MEFFSWKYYFGHTTFLYSSRRSSRHHQRTSSELLFNFRLYSRKPQSQQKLAKKICNSTVSLKKSVILQTWTHWHLKYHALAVQPKIFLTFKHFPADMFLLGVRETFALHHFLMSKNSIFKVLWKQMSVYFCISP